MDPALTSHISSSVFSVLISKQLFSRAWSWSVIFIGQVLISQILGEIFAQDGAHPPDPAKPEPVLIIDEYFVSGLISSAVPGVRNNNKIINNKLKCGDVVKCAVAA